MGSPNTYTTTDFIDLVLTLGHVPQSNSTFTAAKILLLADFEAMTGISKQLKEADEGYFQTILEYDQNDTGIYNIPSASIASTAYILQVRNGPAIWPISRQEVSEMTSTEFPSVGNYSYYMQGNKAHVLPIQFGGVLRVVFERRLSKLVLASACAKVTAINGQVVSVSSVPSAWLVGSTIDLQAAQPQFDYLGLCEITNINALDITLDGDLTDLIVGDYLCLEGQTCVPQMPVEFQQLLAQRVVCKIYELQGYLDKLAAAKKVLMEMESNLTALITPRTAAAPKVINPSWGGRRPGNSWARFNPPAGRNN